MRYPKYKLAFPGKHVWVFNGKPMTQFDGYSLQTIAIGSGLVSASTNKGFYGDTANIFVSAAPENSFSGYAVDYGSIQDNIFTFGKHDAILSALFRETTVRSVILQQTNGGIITATPLTGLMGDIVTLSSNPSSHYSFGSYDVEGAILTGDQFAFQNKDVTAKVNWVQDPIYTVLLTQTNGGTITAIPLTGYSGDVITLSANPSAHYSLSGWNVSGATLNGNQIILSSINPGVSGIFVQDPIRTLVLNQSEGGRITANKLTGFDGDVVTLSNTPSSNYTFGNYYLIGAFLSGNQFAFNGQNVTANAVFISDAMEYKTFTASGYFAPVSTYEISQNVNGAGSVTFQNYGTLVYTGGQGVPENWLKIIGGIPSAFMPDTDSISGASARLYNSFVDCSAYFKDANNHNLNFKYNQDNPYIRFTLEDIDGVYNEAHTVAYSFKENDLELVYGGKVKGKDNYYDNTYSTVTYGTLPGGFSWYTLYSANVSANATGAYLDMAHPGSNNFWVMSGGYYSKKTPRTVTLQQSTGGTISANPMSGYDGTIVSLSNTANSNYNFNNYSVTGGTLTGNNVKLSGSDITAKGSFTIKPTRSVTVNTAAGGTVVANPTTGYDGTVVTLSQTANAGYTFNNYSITGGTLTGNQFTLTGSNVTVQPNYTHNVYSLTLQTDGHGKLAAGKTTGYYNDTTTLTATPSSNYAFNSYSITGGSITNNVYKWGTTNGTVKANFKTAARSATILLKYPQTLTSINVNGVTKVPVEINTFYEIAGVTGDIPFSLSCNDVVSEINYAQIAGNYSISNSGYVSTYSNSAVDASAFAYYVKSAYMYPSNTAYTIRSRSNIQTNTGTIQTRLYDSYYIAEDSGSWSNWSTISPNALGTSKNGWYMWYNNYTPSTGNNPVPGKYVELGHSWYYILNHSNSVYTYPDQVLPQDGQKMIIYW